MSLLLANIIDRSRREREDWRYTDVEKVLAAKAVPTPVAKNETLPSIAGNAHGQYIVFKNGVLDEARTRWGDLAPASLQKDAGGYRLALAAQSCRVTAPIELVFVGEGQGENACRLAVDIGSNTSVTVVEHHLASGGDSIQSIETDIRLGEQAKLVHEKIMHALHGTAHFAATNVRVEKGAYYRNFTLIKDTRLTRNEIDVTLAGPLAQCGLYAAMLLRGREHADVLTRVNHDAKHGTSRQLVKAVVKDQARGVFQGRIKASPGADKTDGEQLCRALLLSDQAEMDAKPELEIHADDVACAHGCAVGELDREAMFYLRSRGLPENEARALLLRAFVDEVVDEIQLDDARATVRGLAEEWMNG